MYLESILSSAYLIPKKLKNLRSKTCDEEVVSNHRDKRGDISRMENYRTAPMVEQMPEDPTLSSACVTFQSSVFSSIVTFVESEHFHTLVLSQG